MRCLPGWALGAALTGLGWATTGAVVAAAEPPVVERFLTEGRLEEGEAALAAALKERPDDDQARFGLGVVQFLRAVEARVQGFYRHGLRTELGPVVGPITNLPVGTNPNPEPIDAAGLRAMFQAWVIDLGRAEETLARIEDPSVKLPLHFGLIRLDVNGDGRRDAGESLWQVYARFNQPAARSITAEAARAFVVSFDRGDVDWLRGYCHLLMAVGELALAHDFNELFDATGHLFFRGAKPPQPFLTPRRPGERFDIGEALDFVAAVHLIRLRVAEPARMKTALGHLESTVVLSRTSWKAILAETDDDQEWVPNPKQSSVIPARVTSEMIQGWFSFLDEFGAILAGKKLAPFWRGDNPRLGVNVRKVFTEPRTLDLVLWVQGTAAVPFLEEGDITSPEFWARINRIFRGEFIGFAIWFN